MSLAALSHVILAKGLVQPLFALHPTPGESLLLLLIFFGPFVIAGILLAATVVIWFRNRRAAALCLFSTVMLFLIGYGIWWIGQRPVRESHARWAAQVATNPEKLWSSEAKDADIRLLRNSSRLMDLNVSHCGLSNDAMAYIGGLTLLESLDIGETRIGDVGLEHLERLTHLRHLSLRGLYRVTDQGLHHLRPLTHLETLDLSMCQEITDAGLESLRPLTHLRQLDLGFCKTTDAGVAHLEKLSALQWLDLAENKITDASVERLAKLTNLRSLSVSLTQVTEHGVKRLQQSLPNCRIYYKNDDYLKIDNDKEDGD
jgi:Leucine-rich repeat (LRR) protein